MAIYVWLVTFKGMNQMMNEWKFDRNIKKDNENDKFLLTIFKLYESRN